MKHIVKWRGNCSICYLARVRSWPKGGLVGLSGLQAQGSRVWQGLDSDGVSGPCGEWQGEGLVCVCKREREDHCSCNCTLLGWQSQVSMTMTKQQQQQQHVLFLWMSCFWPEPESNLRTLLVGHKLVQLEREHSLQVCARIGVTLQQDNVLQTSVSCVFPHMHANSQIREFRDLSATADGNKTLQHHFPGEFVGPALCSRKQLNVVSVLWLLWCWFLTFLFVKENDGYALCGGKIPFRLITDLFLMGLPFQCHFVQ